VNSRALHISRTAEAEADFDIAETNSVGVKLGGAETDHSDLDPWTETNF
jgi:hypothetical protein